jgi:hypothetical protein
MEGLNLEQSQSQENILNVEQQRIADLESVISSITLEEGGKINLQDQGVFSERTEVWKNKDGVIDVQEFDGAIIVIYNANEKIPEGCPDLRGLRSGEYNPETSTCYVDLSDSWSFLENKYVPAMLQQYVRHELRHNIVNKSDTEHIAQHRYTSWGELEEFNRETATQLAYLDELHSQYFDVIDGDLGGRDFFTKLNAGFYTIHKKGSHIEVATTKPENAEVVSNLFHNLQASILYILGK